MNSKNENQMPRRKAITACLRYAVLGGIGIISGRLMTRRQSASGENSCVDRKGEMGCRHCNVLARCGQPRALSVKQFLKNTDEKRNS